MRSRALGIVLMATCWVPTSVAQAEWSWWTAGSRWLGYGFGDGYHRCPCADPTSAECQACRSGGDLFSNGGDFDCQGCMSPAIVDGSFSPLPATQGSLDCARKPASLNSGGTSAWATGAGGTTAGAKSSRTARASGVYPLSSQSRGARMAQSSGRINPATQLTKPTR